MIRYRLVFKGYVQGVGFRYFVYRTAERHALTGYVRNLDDGSVEAEVQGGEEAFADFLAAVRKGNGLARIRSYTAADMPILPDERQFEIY